ncbi:hypothetical protein T484DRAFT_1980587 [Baffinella frigidus]|nr:hypothetical protein T484DRAFT_1980587 [Cryptophyta sp. CCMP2293]
MRTNPWSTFCVKRVRSSVCILLTSNAVFCLAVLLVAASAVSLTSCRELPSCTVGLAPERATHTGEPAPLPFELLSFGTIFVS